MDRRTDRQTDRRTDLQATDGRTDGIATSISRFLGCYDATTKMLELIAIRATLLCSRLCFGKLDIPNSRKHYVSSGRPTIILYQFSMWHMDLHAQHGAEL